MLAEWCCLLSLQRTKMAGGVVNLYSKWKRVAYILAIILLHCAHFSFCEECGPFGYDAKDLLRPNYWLLDLKRTECEKIPWTGTEARKIHQGNATECRLYMNLCKSMKFQCSGSVCLRYLDTSDYVVLLGESKAYPFHEGTSAFSTQFEGDALCGSKNVKTTINFQCQHNSTWNTTEVHFNKGAKAPNPTSFAFNNKTCELLVNFLYSGACFHTEPGEAPGKSISVGSVILILFFPGLALYFLVGMLVNRMAGRSGSELIPHSKFWLDLPDLIMEGFIFSMGVITCRKADARMSYENM